MEHSRQKVESTSSSDQKVVFGVERVSSQPEEILVDKVGSSEVSGETISDPVVSTVVVDDTVLPVATSVPSVGLPVPVSDLPGDKNPIIAEDNDLIEAEWVKRAKDIVSENKKDPYLQGESVAGLKVDYLKKRFGREIGNGL